MLLRLFRVLDNKVDDSVRLLEKGTKFGLYLLGSKEKKQNIELGRFLLMTHIYYLHFFKENSTFNKKKYVTHITLTQATLSYFKLHFISI